MRALLFFVVAGTGLGGLVLFAWATYEMGRLKGRIEELRHGRDFDVPPE
jgi:hypothetical protein